MKLFLLSFLLLTLIGCSPAKHLTKEEREYFRAKQKLGKLVLQNPKLAGRDTTFKLDTTIFKGIHVDTGMVSKNPVDSLVVHKHGITAKAYKLKSKAGDDSIGLKIDVPPDSVIKKMPVAITTLNPVLVVPKKREGCPWWVYVGGILIAMVIAGKIFNRVTNPK